MSLPQVVIVGRPNVGKSTLFNALVRKRVAIEEPTAGVTRDRISAIISHKDRNFELVDTGGLGIEDSMGLDDLVERQIQYALDKADILVFVTDIKDGVTPLDSHVADKLRTLAKPVIVVANKCDLAKDEIGEGEICRLGYGRPLLCSAIGRYGRTDLLDLIVDALPAGSGMEAGPSVVMKLAVVGKRNAGKSTFINALAKEDRVIVSEIPGTTRDAIDVIFDIDGQKLMAIDTAGVLRKKSIQNAIEFFSLARAKSSIRRADVVLLMFDIQRDISKLEKQLSAEILEHGKPCILLVNKWDMAGEVTTEEYAAYLRAALTGMSFAPISFASAQTGLNLSETVRLAMELYEQSGQRVGTGELNRVLERIIQQRSPRARSNRSVKIYYGSQIDIRPPTFCLFVNDKSLFEDDYLRFIERTLREEFDFTEIPLRIVLRNSR